MRLDRRLADDQPLGDLAIAQPFGKQGEHLTLAGAEPLDRIVGRRRAAGEVGQHPARERGRDARLTARHGEHGFDQLGGRRVLGEVSRGADAQRRVQVGLVLGDGEHEHLRAAARPQSRARAQTVDAGHLEIEQHDVRSPALGERQRLGAVGGEPDHLDALVCGEQRRRALPHQPVIVDDKNANRHRTPTVA